MKIVRNAFLPGTLPYGGLPFKDMNVGDMVICDEDKARRAYLQRYVSVYGSKTGKKFVTRTVGEELHVYRVA